MLSKQAGPPLLAPFHTEFERAFNLPAVRPPSYSDLVHDYQDLDFLLEVGHPNVLMRLSVEQERFHQTLESLRVRNNFYVDEVQPVIAKNSFNRKPVPAQEFEAALGERLFGTAINSANILYSLVAESVQSLLPCTPNFSEWQRCSTQMRSSSSLRQKPNPSIYQADVKRAAPVCRGLTPRSHFSLGVCQAWARTFAGRAKFASPLCGEGKWNLTEFLFGSLRGGLADPPLRASNQGLLTPQLPQRE